MSKKTAILDVSGCKNSIELHRKIKSNLNFPEYYGENWDAFRDCIKCENAAEYIIVKGISSVPEGLKPSIEIMLELLEENKRYWEDTEIPFDYKLSD